MLLQDCWFFLTSLTGPSPQVQFHTCLCTRLLAEWGGQWSAAPICACSAREDTRLLFRWMLRSCKSMASLWLKHSLAPTHKCQARGWTGHKHRFPSRRYDKTRNQTRPIAASMARAQPTYLHLSNAIGNFRCASSHKSNIIPDRLQKMQETDLWKA